MKITDILSKEHIIINLISNNKEKVLKEFSGFLEKNNAIKSGDVLFKALIDREKLGSTGIGENVAIPHAKLDSIDKIIIVFARSIKGVNFESLDKKLVHFICLVIAPSNSTGLHLKALARISRLLKNSTLRDNILHANKVDEIFSLLVEEDSKFL